MLHSLYRYLSPKFQSLFLEYKVSLQPRYGHGLPPHQGLYDIINEHRAEYQTLLDKALALKEYIWTIQDQQREQNPKHPCWNNGFLPGLDIIGIYTMIAEFQPKRYIEIGSGNSTKVAYKAKTEHNKELEIISIDPMPRVEMDNLASKIIRAPFEKIDLSVLDSLAANDILFVDNSHRILPNSDAMVFFLEILPRLKRGVILHIHDVYLPYDYPQFMCDRFYSEQYGLAMYLLANPRKFRPLLPNYFIFEDKELSAQIEPIWAHENLQGVERHGGSFWLRIAE